jgi:hypothetical protein
MTAPTLPEAIRLLLLDMHQQYARAKWLDAAAEQNVALGYPEAATGQSLAARAFRNNADMLAVVLEAADRVATKEGR